MRTTPSLYREGYEYVLNGDYAGPKAFSAPFMECYPGDALLPDARSGWPKTCAPRDG